MKLRTWMLVVVQLIGYAISVLGMVLSILLISWVFDYVEKSV